MERLRAEMAEQGLIPTSTEEELLSAVGIWPTGSSCCKDGGCGW